MSAIPESRNSSSSKMLEPRGPAPWDYKSQKDIMFKLRRQEFIILCSATSFFLPRIRIVIFKLQLLKAVEALHPHLALFDIAHHQEYWVVYQGMP